MDHDRPTTQVIKLLKTLEPSSKLLWKIFEKSNIVVMVRFAKMEAECMPLCTSADLCLR